VGLASARPILTLRELEAFDPVSRPASAGGRARYLCPLCHGDRRPDAAHRCLAVEVSTGLWTCHRCGAAGQLREHWAPRADPRPLDRRARAQLALARAAALQPPPPPEAPLPPARADLPALLAGYRAALMPKSPAAAYLARRGIPVDLARQLAVGYAPPGRWPGRPWRGGHVVFPLTDGTGRLLNLQGRAIPDAGGDAPVRYHTLTGPGGYFAGGALRDPGDEPVAVVEGPFDALALRAAGLPRAVAVQPGGGWRWSWARGVRWVVVALDADETGTATADALDHGARVRGLRVTRPLPGAYGGAKDPGAAWAAGTLALPPAVFGSPPPPRSPGPPPAVAAALAAFPGAAVRPRLPWQGPHGASDLADDEYPAMHLASEALDLQADPDEGAL